MEVTVALLLLEDLTDSTLDETGCCSNAGEDPHPENSSRTSHNDCCSNTSDVTDTNSCTHTGTECLEGGDGLLTFLFFNTGEGNLTCLTKSVQLNTLGSDSKVEA